MPPEIIRAELEALGLSDSWIVASAHSLQKRSVDIFEDQKTLDLTMSPPNPIRDVYFSNPHVPKLGMEILTLESLFQRKINQFLQTPQRVHFYHLLLFTQGTGTHTIDFTDSAYEKGTLLLVSKGQVQQFQVNPESRGFIIIFTSEFLYENATGLELFHSLHVFEHALFAPCMSLSAEQYRTLRHLSLIIQHEYQKPVDELSSEILRHLLRVMLLQIERIREDSTLSQRVAPHYQEFVAFRQLVERDLGKSRSVQYYARQLAVSPKKLNELTRQVLNKTAKDFIEEQVILETRRLLAQGDLPIKEIAFRMGFIDPTNLVKFFKKHAHTSPMAFRNQFLPPA